VLHPETKDFRAFPFAPGRSVRQECDMDEQGSAVTVVGEGLAEPEIVEMPQPLPLYAHDLFTRAEQYREAAQLIEDHGAGSSSLLFPTYFVLSHALELYLKAFLVSRGLTKGEIKRKEIRHSVFGLFQRCEQLDLPHIENLGHVAQQFEAMNNNFDFRYPTGYQLHLPTVEMCLPVVSELSNLLNPILNQAAIHAHLQWAADTRHLQGKKVRWSD
jgi:hypothetical protein